MSLRQIAVGGFSGLLLTLTAQAGAAPNPDPSPPLEEGTRPCFMQPHHWNGAVNGPLPRCSLRVSSAPNLASGRASTGPYRDGDHGSPPRVGIGRGLPLVP
jgi:hypothetical protein